MRFCSSPGLASSSIQVIVVTYVLILAGLVLLAVGGELLVRGAGNAARMLGVSPLLAGLTIVGFGTSSPELVTSLFAAFGQSPGIAVGNVVGSNIANILLVLGISAVIAPMVVKQTAFRRDGIALAGSTLACLAAVLYGQVDRIVGALLVFSLVGYILWTYRNERRVTAPDDDTSTDCSAETEDAIADAAALRRRIMLALALAAVGIGATVFGAKLLVDGAIGLARTWGASETLIGLTIVAVGTSLPEMVVCAIAAARNQSDIALGNVIGSNIYNVLGVLGLTAIVYPIRIPAEIIQLDIWVLVGASALVLMFLRSGWTLKRWEGAVFLGLYACYLGYLATTA